MVAHDTADDPRPAHRVAVAATQGAPIFEMAIPCEVFSNIRDDLADPWYDLVVCAPSAGVRTQAGFAPSTEYGFDALADADTVVVPACANVHDVAPPDLVDAVRAAYDDGARIVSLCSGAFVLAAAGILDGRPATTHWRYAGLLAARFPKVRVDASVLYTDDGNILTSAGTAAGLDLCLHVVRLDHGAAVANALAKRLVMPPHRPGGQAQYIDTAAPPSDPEPLGLLLDWTRRHLDEPLTVASLATQANLSARTLIRRFHAVTGTTPMSWLLGVRLNRARELLETTTLPVAQIAERCGLGSPANFRHHFARVVGTSPSAYRRTFAESG
jgi:AraC family transcriptional regulator, transcriptional activator FtrA